LTGIATLYGIRDSTRAGKPTRPDGTPVRTSAT
jgi:hypothetical protein